MVLSYKAIKKGLKMNNPINEKKQEYKPRLSNRLKKLYLITGACTLGNFIIFVTLATFIGGDALSGKMDDGHYYLRMGSKLTEVSPSIYFYSFAHALFTIALVLVMMAVFYFIAKSQKKQAEKE